MITDFKGFGPIHLASLLLAVIAGTAFIVAGTRVASLGCRKKLRVLLALVIVAIRGARYIMDVIFGVFEWPDLLSLHICHIDLILLVICLIKPNRALFCFCFMIGIPTALSVALFPGKIHPAPGVTRAMLFIMSHAMLVMGALYLLIAERMKPTFKMFGLIAAAGSFSLIPVYFINRELGTNYLYIMKAPEGTVLVLFERLFGWPGYVFALIVLAVALMLLMLGIGRLISGIQERAEA
jgi:hypothetical integral membrane protein (TIGR02206 family)